MFCAEGLFPYEIGGFQFSNGKVWARIMARELETNRSGKASLFNPGKNGNYAIGGAKASTGRSPCCHRVSTSLAPCSPCSLTSRAVIFCSGATLALSFPLNVARPDIDLALDVLDQALAAQARA